MVSTRIGVSLLASLLLTASAAPLWGQAVANAQISGSVVITESLPGVEYLGFIGNCQIA